MNNLFLIGICFGRRIIISLPSPMLYRCAQLSAAFNLKGLIKKVFIMLFTVALIFGCGHNDILEMYDTRNCILKANGSNRVAQLAFG